MIGIDDNLVRSDSRKKGAETKRRQTRREEAAIVEDRSDREEMLSAGDFAPDVVVFVVGVTHSEICRSN